MSTITITGNLGADAELRYTPNGRPVLNARVGHTKRRREGDRWVDDGPTTWYQLAIWGSMAETLAETNALVKGVRVTVLGELSMRPYDTASGVKISHDVRVTAIGWHDKQRAQHGDVTRVDDPWAVQEPPAEVGW